MKNITYGIRYADVRTEQFRGIAEQEEKNTYSISKDDLFICNRCCVCGSESFSVLTEVSVDSALKILSTVACNKCLFVFRSISPNIGWFYKCWSRIETDDVVVTSPILEAEKRTRYGKVADLLKGHVTGKDVLEIGPGFGAGSKLFKDNGYSIEVIEPDSNKAKYISQTLGIEVVGRDVDGYLQKTDKKYDLILLVQCLEHLDRPDEALKSIRGLLRDEKSVLYVQVPLVDTYVDWSDALYLAHKSNFSEQAIKRLVETSGYSIIQTDYSYERDDQSIDLILKKCEQSAMLEYEALSEIEIGDQIDQIRKLYRLNLELEGLLDLHEVLKYDVSAVEHFFQTTNLDKKKLIFISESNTISIT